MYSERSLALKNPERKDTCTYITLLYRAIELNSLLIFFPFYILVGTDEWSVILYPVVYFVFIHKINMCQAPYHHLK